MTCTFPADLTLELGSFPLHCCLLASKMFLQSVHCSLPTVSLHDTLTSYCSCMNKSVFPIEQRSRLALGTSLVQQPLLYVTNTAIHGLLYPVSLQVNSLQSLMPQAQFQTHKTEGAFCNVWLHLKISLDLLSC